MEINWLNKSRSGRCGRSSNAVVYVAHTISSKPAQSSTYIRLGIDVMKHCRFLAGDCVMVGFGTAPTGDFLAIRRDPSGRGYTISSTRGKKGYGRADLAGVIKLKKQQVPSVRVPLEKCVFDEAGTFIIPLIGGENV